MTQAGMAEQAEWNGLLSRRAAHAEVELLAVLQRSPQGTSGTFRARASDGRFYWTKVLNNPQGERAVIADQLVGRVGLLIDAPVCHVVTIQVPRSRHGQSVAPGVDLQAGIAHGSLEVPGRVLDIETLSHGTDDSNAERQAAYVALYDWCFGGDVQGLIAVDEGNRFFSHDHGWFLPGGANWTSELALEVLNEGHEYPSPGTYLSSEALDATARRLETLDRQRLVDALLAIPASWPVPNRGLEEWCFFLEHRDPSVDVRLRALAAMLTSPAT